ncbi:hypothetical protein NECAME_09552 [Necator americanus]|uniref:Uncharacterized protein n=1 Tax=Necator americanus TaxID=51031 RepID=W2TFS2_NECAM|nr:hypothetical protein NECAME_09552 [Necator americanus]ETN79852.1 hypothetical protein NECAME_09552 [Necator americanus]
MNQQKSTMLSELSVYEMTLEAIVNAVNQQSEESRKVLYRILQEHVTDLASRSRRDRFSMDIQTHLKRVEEAIIEAVAKLLEREKSKKVSRQQDLVIPGIDAESAVIMTPLPPNRHSRKVKWIPVDSVLYHRTMNDLSPQCQSLMAIWNDIGFYLCNIIAVPAQGLWVACQVKKKFQVLTAIGSFTIYTALFEATTFLFSYAKEKAESMESEGIFRQKKSSLAVDKAQYDLFGIPQGVKFMPVLRSSRDILKRAPTVKPKIRDKPPQTTKKSHRPASASPRLQKEAKHEIRSEDSEKSLKTAIKSVTDPTKTAPVQEELGVTSSLTDIRKILLDEKGAGVENGTSTDPSKRTAKKKKSTPPSKSTSKSKFKEEPEVEKKIDEEPGSRTHNGSRKVTKIKEDVPVDDINRPEEETKEDPATGDPQKNSDENKHCHKHHRES